MPNFYDQFDAPKSGGNFFDQFDTAPAAEPIGENRMSTIAALRGIPIAGGYVDKATAMLNAAAQPFTETGLSHADTYAERVAENERRIKAAVDQYEADHPIGTGIGKAAMGTAAMAPLGATATGAKALGLVGGSLARQAAAGAASGAAIGGLDAAARGEDILPAAGKGFALGLVGPAAGRVVGKVAQGARDLVAGKPGPALPTSDEIKDAASAGYDAIRKLDVRLRPDAINNLAATAKQNLTNDGLRDYLAPKTFAILDELAQPPAQGAHVSFADIHGIRRALGKAAQSIDPTEKGAATSVIKSLDNYLESVPAADVVKGDANIASQLFNRAQANYAASKRADLLQGKVNAAELQAASANSGANVENALRQRIKDILKSPKLRQGFSPDEILQLQRIVRGTAPANVVRAIGNALGGGGGLGSLITAGAGAMAAGPAGVAAPLAGAAVKKLGNKMTMNQVERLDEMIRSRAPESAMVAALRNALELRRARQLSIAGSATGAMAPGLVPAFSGQSDR